MKRRRWTLPLTLFGLVAAFGAGVLTDRLMRAPDPVHQTVETIGPPPEATPVSRSRVETGDAGVEASPPGGFAAAPATTSEWAPAPPAEAVPSTIVETTLHAPIDGANMALTRGAFLEMRGDHPHEAVDILAPRNTPIHAVQSGTVAKLFLSKAGGLTIYEIDPSGRLCYYYAHLERYADGLADGDHVAQGQVIGYVGTSGNAPPDTPHLHFAVFELDSDQKWWRGHAIDPYPLLSLSPDTPHP